MKPCRLALIVLSLMQLFSCIAGDVTFPQRFAPITLSSFAWTVIELSPILVLLLVRRVCSLIAIMAIPISVVFCGRIYYGTLLLESRYRSPQGDWAIWLIQLVGLISIIIITVWLAFRVARFAVDLIARAATSPHERSDVREQEPTQRLGK